MNPLGGANMHFVSNSQLKLKEPINSYNSQHLEYVISAAYRMSFLRMQWEMKAYILAVISTVPDL